jgi:hypothetical protein
MSQFQTKPVAARETAPGDSLCDATDPFANFESDLNPVTTEGWRWKAVELMASGQDKDEGPIPSLTAATDVWAFGMAAIEVSKSTTTSLPFFLKWPAGLF